MWKSRSPGVETAVWTAPLTAGKGWSSAGEGRLVTRSHTRLPMPTVQLSDAPRSRMATFLVRSPMLASVERTVGIALGLSAIDRTRKVADLVNGASTRCGSMEALWLILAFLACVFATVFVWS